MAKKEAPKKVWMTGVNLGGLWCNAPIRGYWNADRAEWYDKKGDLSVRQLGLHAGFSIIPYAAVDKDHVQRFIEGAMAVVKVARNNIFCIRPGS